MRFTQTDSVLPCLARKIYKGGYYYRMQNIRYLTIPICLIGIISPHAHAQIVTSSFNKSMLAVNPAAAATKNHGFFSLSISRENSSSKINEERPDGDKNEWKSKYQIDKRELILTASGQTFFPELYLSMDKLKQELDLSNPATSSTATNEGRDVDFINNLFNLGYKVSNRTFLGFRYFMPRIKYKFDNEYEYSDNQTTGQKGKVNDKMTGIGAGFSIKLTENTYFGAFYTRMTLDSSGEITNVDNTGNESEGNVVGSHSFASKGLGLSYKKGDFVNNAIRFELAYSWMDFPYDIPSGSQIEDADPKQIYLAGEMAIRGINFGGSMKLNKGPFREHMNMVKDSVDEGIGGDEFVTTYDYFFSFTSKKGHGGGIRGSYFHGEGKKKLFGVEQPAKITESTMGLTYSYTF